MIKTNDGQMNTERKKDRQRGKGRKVGEGISKRSGQLHLQIVFDQLVSLDLGDDCGSEVSQVSVKEYCRLNQWITQRWQIIKSQQTQRGKGPARRSRPPRAGVGPVAMLRDTSAASRRLDTASVTTQL